MNRVIGGWLTSGPQHRPLDHDADHDHRHERDRHRTPERNAALDQADEGQRREQDQRALSEVEHARGLVDDDEADRDQGVHHARQQAAEQHLEEELELGHQCARRHRDAVIDAQIGVDHRLVGADLVRQPVRDLAAMVEHGDPVGERHDDADIVLDQHDGRAELVARITDEAAHLAASRAALMPAIGSSSSKSRGRAISARANSTRFCSP